MTQPNSRYGRIIAALKANGFTIVETVDGTGELTVSINGLPPMNPQDAVAYGIAQLQALNVPGV